MNERRVYVVTEGRYSGYHIEAVFEKLEDAEVAAKMCGGEVETYPLNGKPGDPVTVYSVEIDGDGNEVGRWENTWLPWDANEPWVMEGRGWLYLLPGGPPAGACGQSTRGYDVALKIARDKLAEAKYDAEKGMRG